MKEYFKNKEALSVVLNMIDEIQANRDYLSDVDGKIGDGDHGVNMNKGFTLCRGKIEGKPYSFSEGLDILGKTLLMEIGGSMGPLYGKFFIEMSKSVQDEVDKQVILDMLESGIKAIQLLSKAQPGDKTLIDTLMPATEAYRAAVADDLSFHEALLKLKEASERGMMSTKEMVAKIGRASRLGERSKGVLDPGAASCNIILQSLSDGIIKLCDMN